MTRLSKVIMLTLRRLLYAIPVFVLGTFLVFALAGASPLDPLAYRLGAVYFTMSSEHISQLQSTWGLDLPWYIHYKEWLFHAVQGDFGFSISQNLPIAAVVAGKLKWTVLLSTVGLVIALILSFVGGLACAKRPGSWLDKTLVAIAQLLASTPSFVAGAITLGVLAGMFQIIPAGGIADPGEAITASQVLRHIVAPSVLLGITMTPAFILHMREAMLATMNSPFVYGARLRGVPEKHIRSRHAMPVAILPVIGLIGARIPEVITGAVVIESIFAWPGVAKGFVDAGLALDFPLLAALTLLATAMVLFGTWLSDVVIVLIDPRVSQDV